MCVCVCLYAFVLFVCVCANLFCFCVCVCVCVYVDLFCFVCVRQCVYVSVCMSVCVRAFVLFVCVCFKTLLINPCNLETALSAIMLNIQRQYSGVFQNCIIQGDHQNYAGDIFMTSLLRGGGHMA